MLWRELSSPTPGAYCELNDLPENFYGTLGDEVEQRFLTQKQALELLNRVYRAIPSADADNTRSFSIFALYSRRGIVDRKKLLRLRIQPRTSSPAS